MGLVAVARHFQRVSSTTLYKDQKAQANFEVDQVSQTISPRNSLGHNQFQAKYYEGLSFNCKPFVEPSFMATCPRFPGVEPSFDSAFNNVYFPAN